MFKIVQKSPAREDIRLESDAALTPTDFERIANEPGRQRLRARKVGFVAARQAVDRSVIETHWNGRETTNTARPGDWIVTNLTPHRAALRDRQGHVNTYVIRAERFPALYEATGAQHEFGAVYRAKGVVEAIRLPSGFDIVAPWGERQTSPSGYVLCNGTEVYGSHAETFEATYRAISG